MPLHLPNPINPCIFHNLEVSTQQIYSSVKYLHIKSYFSLIFVLLALNSGIAQTEFELIGHRGCRGLMPENTFSAFMRAVELGVTTIDMDVVISGDGQIVISNEPWISADICAHPDGSPVTKKEEMELNIYQMDYREFQIFNCGERYNAEFPDQNKFSANKPTLKMVVRMIRGFAEDNKFRQPKFNIEIKSDPKWYNKYQPEPEELVEMVTTTIKHLGIADITTFQSTDINVLEALNNITDRTYTIGYVVTKGKNLKKNLSKLSFIPDVYNPLLSLVTQGLVEQCHQSGMKIIPWVVNDKSEMDKIKSWGCDGGVTDFPDVVR